MLRWLQTRMAFFTLATLGALSSTGTFAQSSSISGNDLFSACEADKDTPIHAFCTGYVIGYVEGRNWGTYIVVNRLSKPESTAEGNKIGNQLVGHCVPEEANYQQLIDVAVSYMQRHPESRHESARTLIWSSFIEAFPCGQ